MALQMAIDGAYKKIDIFHFACFAFAELKNPHREYPNTPTVLKNQYTSVVHLGKSEKLLSLAFS
ncbi:hypothetical protein EZS27_037854 [termite gut metagenome]|uniref:Uncharacterized protein n=1 Tax=termite gut metagenome TaxID=433724 RepID=A0A5J4PMV8_9ZZZZ